MALARGAPPNPADNIISGTIDNGATWYQDITLTQDGAQLTGVSDHVWTLVIYPEPGADSDLTLTTADSTLTVTEGAETTLLSIRCKPDRMSDLCGDYWCDIKSVDSSPTVDGASRVYLRGRGIVTFVKGAV